MKDSNEWSGHKSKFDMIPTCLTKGKKFNGTDIKVYAYILRNTFFRDRKVIRIYNAEIAKYIDVHPRSVTRAIGKLIDTGIVGIKSRTKHNKTLRNLYLKVYA